jgi:predicted N-formylglutamate amidohydrolase
VNDTLATDPSPVLVFHEGGRPDLLLIGDHAGDAIPSALGDLGISREDRARHIAVDIGVRGLGEHLATALGATFVHQAFSRLVIDCNRAPLSPTSIVETSDGTTVPGNVGLGAAAREQRRVTIHEPYHRRIALEMRLRKATGVRPILVSLHSFTPVLGSQPRPWHLGVLHDGGDTTLSLAMLTRLRKEDGLPVGDNEPYRMDAVDYTIARHAYANGAPYLEIEFRQDLIASADDARRWAARFAGWLGDAMAAVAVAQAPREASSKV